MQGKQIGSATLYHARMEDVIPSVRFDHIFTDPPYGFGLRGRPGLFDDLMISSTEGS
jgi:hypothetical protein